MEWPPGFQRIPDDEWTAGDIDPLALGYDAVKNHGWYHNLDFTIEQLADFLRKGDSFLDYSGGTGIFLERLFSKKPGLDAGTMIVDSSAKFLRLALEKFRGDERVAFRLIRYLKEKKRLEYVDEVLDLLFDAVISTNAIHLYYDLGGTLRSWLRVLKPGGKAFIQSGNVENPEAGKGEWIIDQTVESVHEAAVRIVENENRYSHLRGIVRDLEVMKEQEGVRKKYFLPTRKLEYYLEELRGAGFAEVSSFARTIEVSVLEWGEFLSVYHQGILGWVPDVGERVSLLREAMEKVFSGTETFACCWSYLTATSP